MLSMSNAEMFIHAFMTSRLDYCNPLLGGYSAHLINKLQMVQNAAARVFTRTRKYEHISRFSQHCTGSEWFSSSVLEWLLSHYSPTHPLRSQISGHLIIPRISKSTVGGRFFFYLVHKLWNNLPNTVREADTLSV